MNAHTPVLKPYGCPQGVDPRQWRQSVETRLNDLLDRAMALNNRSRHDGGRLRS